MCAEDGESQTLLIIGALIRMSALKNILEGLQLALSGLWRFYERTAGSTSGNVCFQLFRIVTFNQCCPSIF
ncbi:hypothetical protein NTGM5_120015 [Candidatus Nitrotoga sp. M5]|nr:hypothetical protein NTGM5_120015 [Candidatus Nitrotoga sp. M5]